MRMCRFFWILKYRDDQKMMTITIATTSNNFELICVYPQMKSLLSNMMLMKKMNNNA